MRGLEPAQETRRETLICDTKNTVIDKKNDVVDTKNNVLEENRPALNSKEDGGNLIFVGEVQDSSLVRALGRFQLPKLHRYE